MFVGMFRLRLAALGGVVVGLLVGIGGGSVPVVNTVADGMSGLLTRIETHLATELVVRIDPYSHRGATVAMTTLLAMMPGFVALTLAVAARLGALTRRILAMCLAACGVLVFFVLPIGQALAVAGLVAVITLVNAFAGDVLVCFTTTATALLLASVWLPALSDVIDQVGVHEASRVLFGAPDSRVAVWALGGMALLPFMAAAGVIWRTIAPPPLPTAD